jgi:hypothetical protein
MSAILSDRRAHLKNTSGDLPLIGAARNSHPTVTSGSDAEGDWILALIKRAQERVMSQKEAVITMGVDKAQYIRSLSGDGHLSVRRLGLLPADFWLALIDELQAHYGIHNDEQQLTRAFDALRASLSVIERVARKGIR